MKRTISAILAATLMVPAIAMAQPGRDHHDDHNGPAMHGPAMRGPAMHGPSRGGPPAGWHQFRKGQRFDRAHAWNYREIDYRHYRGLRAPPRGYRWVRNGNDAVLVAISTGIVASVIAGAITN
ncbi:MAG: RcnB family protein [Sphingomonadales bacterium]|nr:RcnB family protein [Sphingomonadales bacterium]MDE2170507.1 RcnB family protein [Sphingomonadales bacterium]